MAATNEWIKMRHVLPDEVEVLAMAARLSLSQEAVVGHLLRVWSWFDLHTRDGNAPCVTLVTLDALARCAGFGDAMVAVGWMELSVTGVRVPNFDRHNGATAKKRALTARRVEKLRRSRNAECNAVSVTPSPSPSPSCSNSSLPEGGSGETNPALTPASPSPADAYELQPVIGAAWDAIPAHDRQGLARFRAEFVRVVRERGVEPADLAERVAAYYASPHGRGGYHWAPHTFLRDGHYEDPEEAWQNERATQQRKERDDAQRIVG